MHIPVGTFIFSWDNLTSKGRIAAHLDFFLVWSNHMRDELLRYYPWIKAKQIHVVGSPQFDPYAWSHIELSRSEFLEAVGGNPERALICYSGGDERTAPEDPLHLRALLNLIRDGAIRGRPQVLLRPAPVDISGRYRTLEGEFKDDLIIAQPRWSALGGDWSQIIPSPEDVVFLANLTLHANLNVNLASTMTLDFAIRDTPVVNVAFDMSDPPIYGRPLREHYYGFEHYRPVVELGAARIARTQHELAAHVNAYLADPQLDRAARRSLVELEVGVPVGDSANAIKRTLEQIGRG